MLLLLGQPCYHKLTLNRQRTAFRCSSLHLKTSSPSQNSCRCSQQRTVCSTVAPGPDDGGGTSTIERPDLLREGSSIINLTEAGFGGTEVTKDKKLGGGNWRVLLLDDAKHTEQLVITAITTVLPGTDVNHAKNCFATSRKLGQAIITSCLKEHAEFYAEQLFKHGARSKIEPDSSII